MTRTRALVASLLLASCGGGKGGGNVDVASLPESSQQALCEEFLDELCTHPDLDFFCTNACIMTACPQAASSGTIANQCFGIMSQQVRECGQTADETVCTSQGGGCMIDALEVTCGSDEPPPPPPDAAI